MRRRRVDAFEVRVGGETLVVASLPTSAESDELAALTITERGVALDAVAGLSNAEIARKRKRKPRTIANQLAAIYRKLGVGSRAELAALVLGPS